MARRRLRARVQEVPRARILDGSFHHALLHDRARVEAYAAAIAAVVREGDVVADLGSGSGILSHLAARAGARKVFAVEANTHSYAALLRLMRKNGQLGRVVPTLADAESWTPPEPVDVVLAELMETGLLHEPILPVLRNVRRWPQAPRAVVPRAATLLVEGVELADEVAGYRASFPSFRHVADGVARTTGAAYARVDFEAGDLPHRVDATVEVRADGGRVDALRLRTVSDLAHGVALESGPAYCTPLVLPLAEPVEAAAGALLRARLRYAFGFGSEPIGFDLRPA